LRIAFLPKAGGTLENFQRRMMRFAGTHSSFATAKAHASAPTQ
jgi:hypothetical protein